MATATLLTIPLLAGYILDLFLGDPEWLPHPVRLFGNAIMILEKALNRGRCRFIKGSMMTLFLCTLTFVFFQVLLAALLLIHPALYIACSSLFVFYGLANKGLISEGRKVFAVLQTQGIEAGRKQLSRIVGRDTSALTPRQVKIAVLETMSENLSDGVVAPLCWYALAGLPGMMTYKMINTLDSMTGYRNPRYEQFGKFAARLDDLVNLLPSRLTALLMTAVTGSRRGWLFIFRYGHKHKSPNAGYSEAALAGILDARFGGPNVYHGVLVQKPYIGVNARDIRPDEISRVSSINHRTCLLTLLLAVAYIIFFP